MSTQDAELPSAPRVEGPPPHLLIVRAPYYREVVDGLTSRRAAHPAARPVGRRKCWTSPARTNCRR